MEALISGRLRLRHLQQRLDARLAQLLPAHDGANPLHAALSHALLSPGKRLRPMLTLLAATQLGADEDLALDPACAVEMVHAASLVLDDLPCMDDADERRGQIATHLRFGEDIAVLAAVALLNHAFAVVVQAPGLSDQIRVQMIAALSSAVGMDGLVVGQARDLRASDNLSPAGLSELHHHKTGVLLVAAVRIGALAAGAAHVEASALAKFATELGLAFQALDDLDDSPMERPSDRPAVSSPDRNSAVALLGREGARQEASRRLAAARSALASGGPRTGALADYIDIMLPPRPLAPALLTPSV